MLMIPMPAQTNPGVEPGKRGIRVERGNLGRIVVHVEDGWWPPVATGTSNYDHNWRLGGHDRAWQERLPGWPPASNILEFDLMLPSGEVITAIARKIRTFSTLPSAGLACLASLSA